MLYDKHMGIMNGAIIVVVCVMIACSVAGIIFSCSHNARTAEKRVKHDSIQNKCYILNEEIDMLECEKAQWVKIKEYKSVSKEEADSLDNLCERQDKKIDSLMIELNENLEKLGGN